MESRAREQTPNGVEERPTEEAPQYPIRENLDRLRDEWLALERKWKVARMDVDKMDQERAHLMGHFFRYYTLAYKLHVELNVQHKINKRIHTLFEAMLSHLDPEVQRDFAGQIEDAKSLTAQDIDDRLQQGRLVPRLAPSSDLELFNNKSARPPVPVYEASEISALHSARSPASPSGMRIEGDRTDAPNAGLPSQVRLMATLPHGDVVCAVAVSNNARHVYTGGRGCVKVWDMFQADRGSLGELECLQDHYIRSCKLLADADILIVGGEAERLCMWDLGGTAPNMVGFLETTAAAVYALAVSPLTAPSRAALCFTCCSDGKINVFDVHNKKLIKSFSAHQDGASCIDISRDGTKLITGGLDKMVRVWDLNNFRSLDQISFSSQVFSLGTGSNDIVAAGLENSELRVFNMVNPKAQQYTNNKHHGPVLSLKFAHAGNWFITTGKDTYLNGWGSPYPATIFEHKESLSILACDISLDDKYVVTGSGNRLATVYEVL